MHASTTGCCASPREPVGSDLTSPALVATARMATPSPPTQRTALAGVRVFDGGRLTEPTTVVLDGPVIGPIGTDAGTTDALVTAAHARGLKVVAHAATHGAYSVALDAGVDIVTHIPLGARLGADEIARMATAGRFCVPTLTMMEGVAAAHGAADAFAGAVQSVTALHRAGVVVLAGTDANTQAGVPAQVAHGESLHHELELLVAAGLSPVQALRSATSEPARVFGLTDRGVVEPGLRADLVLVDGDPLSDIRATRAIRRIWCAGIEHTPADHRGAPS